MPRFATRGGGGAPRALAGPGARAALSAALCAQVLSAIMQYKDSAGSPASFMACELCRGIIAGRARAARRIKTAPPVIGSRRGGSLCCRRGSISREGSLCGSTGSRRRGPVGGEFRAGRKCMSRSGPKPDKCGEKSGLWSSLMIR